MERAVIKSAGSSPHTRGARYGGAAVAPAVRIIPAYAGSTAVLRHPERGCQDHPRIRGEHRKYQQDKAWRSGSSPHTRGAHAPAFSHEAGSGSSPHTRGAPARRRRQGLLLRIIPAYAGSTRRISPGGSSLPDHPRIRGEHVTIPNQVHPQVGIIPAYAGSTSQRYVNSTYPADHPRIRGEHRPRGFRSAPGPGSSPHTRGAPRPLLPLLLGSRIIPAYAGSTWTP